MRIRDLVKPGSGMEKIESRIRNTVFFLSLLETFVFSIYT
jgi:hypothetical protein